MNINKSKGTIGYHMIELTTRHKANQTCDVDKVRTRADAGHQ